MFSLEPQVQRVGCTHTTQLRAHIACLVLNEVQEINPDEGKCDNTDTPRAHLSQTKNSSPVLGAAAITQPQTHILCWFKQQNQNMHQYGVGLTPLIPQVELDENVLGSVATLCHPTMSSEPVFVYLTTKLAKGSNNKEIFFKEDTVANCKIV